MAVKLITPTGKWLRSDAAASWKRTQAAGAPRNRLESAGRTWAAQQKLRNKYMDYINGVGPKANFALAPKDSKHVAGIAVDVHDDLQNWFRANGTDYGWFGVPNEKWHFEYRPASDRVLQKKQIAQKRLRNVKDALGIRGWFGPRKNRRAAQRLLTEYGYYHGDIDGLYGAQTKIAYAQLKKDAS